VRHRSDGVWSVITFPVSDETLVGMDAERDQPRHDMIWDAGFDLRDFHGEFF
jgi:hypothetical protein